MQNKHWGARRTHESIFAFAIETLNQYISHLWYSRICAEKER